MGHSVLGWHMLRFQHALPASLPEAVADPRDGPDELGMFRVVVQSLSQGVHIHIDLAPLPG